jgi:hypothetical protein
MRAPCLDLAFAPVPGGRKTGTLATALVLAAVGLTVAIAPHTGREGRDFEWQASPALDALTRGDLHEASVNFPLEGAFALWIRLPFNLLFFHADVRVVYLMTSLPCIAVFAVALLWLGRRMKSAGVPEMTVTTLIALAAVNTAVVRAIHWGHPEDLLTVGLLLAAALAAPRWHWAWTALVLGLALASKQWAALGVLPILFSAPLPALGRVKLLAVAALTAALLTLPFAITSPARIKDVTLAGGNPDAFWHRGQDTGGVTHITPANVIWPFAERRFETRGGYAARAGFVANWVVTLFHLLALFAVVPICWLVARRPRAGPEEWLGALAAIFLLRSLLDPLDFDYHHVAAIVFLAAWEGLALRRAPLVTAFAVTAIGVIFLQTWPAFGSLYVHAGFVSAAYLLSMVPLTVFVLARLARGSRLVLEHERHPLHTVDHA